VSAEKADELHRLRAELAVILDLIEHEQVM
jgi:hypothetical protein